MEADFSKGEWDNGVVFDADGVVLASKGKFDKEDFKKIKQAHSDEIITM
jgi:hypothetical protein